jgi:hypothetical protein
MFVRRARRWGLCEPRPSHHGAGWRALSTSSLRTAILLTTPAVAAALPAAPVVMPDEPWKHLEISGVALGRRELLPRGTHGAAPAP